MRDLLEYEIAVLLKMYDEQLIGTHYKSTQMVSKKIRWIQIASAYKIKDSFESVARGLVKRMLLSDDGKSMAVLSLAKLGVDFIKEYLQINPNALKDLETRLDKK